MDSILEFQAFRCYASDLSTGFLGIPNQCDLQLTRPTALQWIIDRKTEDRTVQWCVISQQWSIVTIHGQF